MSAAAPRHCRVVGDGWRRVTSCTAARRQMPDQFVDSPRLHAQRRRLTANVGKARSGVALYNHCASATPSRLQAANAHRCGGPCWARTNDQRIMPATSAFAARFRFVVWTLSCLSAFPSSLYTFSLRSFARRRHGALGALAFTEFEKFCAGAESTYPGQPIGSSPAVPWQCLGRFRQVLCSNQLS